MVRLAPIIIIIIKLVIEDKDIYESRSVQKTKVIIKIVLKIINGNVWLKLNWRVSRSIS